VPEEPDVLAELYGSPPDEFVAVRTKLARALRDEGRDEEAREVASRRKPALPAYLANLLAHKRRRDVTALISAAEKLAAAHGSGSAEKVRDAQRGLSERVRKLVALASEVSGGAVSDAVGQRLAETLRAAATDPDTAPLLERGVLPEEVETSGFEALASVQLTASKTLSRDRRGRQTKNGRTRKRQPDARVGRLEKELKEARQELRSAESAAASAEREATRARKRVSDLEARLERLNR
jgi:HAMP domain-containing protein